MLLPIVHRLSLPEHAQSSTNSAFQACVCMRPISVRTATAALFEQWLLLARAAGLLPSCQRILLLSSLDQNLPLSSTALQPMPASVTCDRSNSCSADCYRSISCDSATALWVAAADDAKYTSTSRKHPVFQTQSQPRHSCHSLAAIAPIRAAAGAAIISLDQHLQLTRDHLGCVPNEVDRLTSVCRILTCSRECSMPVGSMECGWRGWTPRCLCHNSCGIKAVSAAGLLSASCSTCLILSCQRQIRCEACETITHVCACTARLSHSSTHILLTSRVVCDLVSIAEHYGTQHT